MRFIFVDRILALEPKRSIEALKNVSATEDVFADHFPGVPILPGALIVEAFDQAAQLLIATSCDFSMVGRLTRLSRVSFRHWVRPGDQLRLRCAVRSASPTWVVAARAEVEQRCVATATLDYALEDARAETAAGEHAERLRVLARELEPPPFDLVARGIQA